MLVNFWACAYYTFINWYELFDRPSFPDSICQKQTQKARPANNNSILVLVLSIRRLEQLAGFSIEIPTINCCIRKRIFEFLHGRATIEPVNMEMRLAIWKREFHINLLPARHWLIWDFLHYGRRSICLACAGAAEVRLNYARIFFVLSTPTTWHTAWHSGSSNREPTGIHQRFELKVSWG